ncbi:hypothetical protein D9758_007702 [Tetrapyrgos nigripes]|uniref:Uncharacterized protein n=1 Tax=Tetrapyrgos nigripes TaxID=182062 RepID=A0A8H5LIT2_9AGAR|nr:hypothetical protein D9758_007702 [Tetrapyrgos nigripes]
MITPLWPYKVGASVSVDGSPGVAINMTDPNAPTQDSGGSETAGFRDVLVSDNLDNKTHSVTISLLPGMDFLAIDGLKYTVPGDNSTDSSSSSSSSHSNPIPIVVGVVGGVVFLALVALTFVLLRRRRRTQFSPVNILGDSRPSSPDPQQGLYDPATHELERATLRSPPAPVLVGGPLSNHSSQTQGYGHLSGDRDTTAAAIRGPVTLSYTDLRRESSEFGLRPTTLYSAAASSASSSSGDPGSSSSRLVAGIYSEKKFESATEEKRRLKEAAEKQEERSEYPDLPPPMYEEHSS